VILAHQNLSSGLFVFETSPAARFILGFCRWFHWRVCLPFPCTIVNRGGFLIVFRIDSPGNHAAVAVFFFVFYVGDPRTLKSVFWLVFETSSAACYWGFTVADLTGVPPCTTVMAFSRIWKSFSLIANHAVWVFIFVFSGDPIEFARIDPSGMYGFEAMIATIDASLSGDRTQPIHALSCV
jgi:hypothetical protein